MKITVERDAFAAAIDCASRSCEKRDTIPILGNILLTPNGQALAMAGTDLDRQFETEVAAEIEGRGSAVTLPAFTLRGLVDQMPKGSQIVLEYEDSQQSVTLRAGRSRYKLVTLPVEDFPNLRKVEDPTKFSLPGKELAALLTATKFAMNNTKDRPYLNGIFMCATDDSRQAFGASQTRRLGFVATDGRDLARNVTDLPIGAENLKAVILPDTSIAEIIKIASDAANDVEILVSADLASFVAGSQKFTTKLVEGTFPDFVRVIPDNQCQAIVDRDQLAGAVSRLRTLDEADKRMRVDLDSGLLKLSLVDLMRGEADESIEVEWTGEPLAIGMRSRGLLSVLDAIKSDLCALRFSNPSTPVLIQPWRNGEFDTTQSYVAMPVRL